MRKRRERKPLRDRLLEKIVLVPNPAFFHRPSIEWLCWLWTGTLDKKGYGRIALCDGPYRSETRTRRGAHALSYVVFRGPFLGPRVPDHLCRVHACINPWHLEQVTRRENVLRGKGLAAKNARKTQCPAGHPYDGENTYVHQKGIRQCRACHRDRMRNRRGRLRANARQLLSLTTAPQVHRQLVCAHGRHEVRAGSRHPPAALSQP